MSEQSAVPIADAVETFVASLRQRAVPLNTIKSYAHDLHLFVQAMPADLTAVTAEQIQVFLTHDEHHSAATRRRRYSTLCTFYHWLLRHEVVDINPMDRLDSIEQVPREPRPLSPEAVTKILQAIDKRMGGSMIGNARVMFPSDFLLIHILLLNALAYQVHHYRPVPRASEKIGILSR